MGHHAMNTIVVYSIT